MSPRPAVIFDLDGTLLDAFEDIAAAVNHPLSAHGFATHSLAAVKEMVGEGAGRLLDRANAHVPQHLRTQIDAEMLAYYREHPADHARLYDGIVEVLQRLRAAGFALAVLSNKPLPMTLKTCDQLGLTPLLDDIVGENGAAAPRKPDPTALRAQLKRLNTDRALIVGDGSPDGEVAHRAGIPFLAVLWGTKTRADLAVWKPWAYVETVQEMEAAILRWAKESK